MLAKEILITEEALKEAMTIEIKATHKELAHQIVEKGNTTTALGIAKKRLVFEKQEKKKRAAELLTVQKKLVKAEIIIEEHKTGLEEIMFIASHKVRQPIANILGIAGILDHFLKAPATLEKMVGYIKESTLSLDGFTKELSSYILTLKKRK